ncbi:MAG: protein kinase [Deltaproteobacteria bacterium]|nr:protein kinase [Deltaproteobacteria bacterium]
MPVPPHGRQPSSFQYDYFVIHAGEDALAAQLLARALGQSSPGCNVFISGRSLEPGTQWIDRVVAAMSRTRVFVILLSPALERAHYARSEIADAIEYERKDERVRVVPVQLRKVSPCAAYGLRCYQWLRPSGLGSMDNVACSLAGLLLVLHGQHDRRRDPGSRAGIPHRLHESRKRVFESASGDSSFQTLRKYLHLRRQLREGGQIWPGYLFGERFQIERHLGTGGFSQVFLARDRSNGHWVAVKVLRPSCARDASCVERFYRGAQRMASLSEHTPRVPTIIQAPRCEEGYHYFVMQYFAGGDLYHAVLSGVLQPAKMLSIIDQVGETLEVAHTQSARLVHRDVKPSNILLDETQRQAFLTDFDLVHAQDTTGGTQAGAMGTLVYSAPEVLDDATTARAASDVYSLAMTAAFIVSRGNLRAEVLWDTNRVIRSLRCGRRVHNVLLRALEKKPEDRFSSIEEFRAALRGACQIPNAPISRSGTLEVVSPAPPSLMAPSPGLSMIPQRDWDPFVAARLLAKPSWIDPLRTFEAGSASEPVHEPTAKRPGPGPGVPIVAGLLVAAAIIAAFALAPNLRLAQRGSSYLPQQSIHSVDEAQPPPKNRPSVAAERTPPIVATQKTPGASGPVAAVEAPRASLHRVLHRIAPSSRARCKVEPPRARRTVNPFVTYPRCELSVVDDGYRIVSCIETESDCRAEDHRIFYEKRYPVRRLDRKK